jgi:phenylacetate-CoA ligase
VGRESWQEMVRHFGATLRATERLGQEEMRAYQAPLLDRLVRHAADTVPFYRERLAPLFVAGKVDLSRWSEIPLLGRAEAVAAGDDLKSRDVPPELGSSSTGYSSGSTGIPFEHLRDRLARVASQANTERSFRWWRVDTSRPLAAITHGAHAGAPEGRTLTGWSSRHPDAPNYMLSVKTGVGEQLDWLLRRRPTYLVTYPSNLRELAAQAQRQGAVLRLDTVMSIGAMVDAPLRELCRAVFGARILDTYGAEEAGHIAAACPDCGGYHVSAESVLVEVLDKDGNAAAPGETGDVVVTPLYGYAMPLIRYRIGDLAVAGVVDAGCDRRLPVLARILGRYRNVFRFADGSSSWPMIPLDRLKAVLPVRQYQCVQISPAAVEFRYVRDPGGPPLDLVALTGLARTFLHADLAVTAVEVDAIARSRTGKYEDYVSLVEEAS